MITLAFTAFGFFAAVILFVAVALCCGDEGSADSLLALRLLTPFIVGSAGSSVALRLDFAVSFDSVGGVAAEAAFLLVAIFVVATLVVAVAFGAAGGGAVDAAAFLVAVFVETVLVGAVGFEVGDFEASFEAAFTPFARGPAFDAAAEAFFGGIVSVI